MTGEWLFLRYAFPCVEDRFILGLIKDTEDLERARRIIKFNGNPSIEFLTRVFPEAVKHFLEFLNFQGVLEVSSWPFKQTALYWRFNHKEGQSPVIQAVVRSFDIKTHITVKVLFGGQEFLALNLYKLPLEVGKTVFIHNKVVVEMI